MYEWRISRAGIVRPVTLDPLGGTGPTRHQAAGRRWRRVAHGYYVPSEVPVTIEQRIAEAMAGMPPFAAVTGWAALAWMGTRWFDGTGRDGKTALPVPVAVNDQHSSARRAGVRVSEDWLFEDDIIEIDGLPVTTPARSVSFEARRARCLEDAVRVIDMAAAGDRVSIATMRAYAALLPGRPGVRRLREALGLADENVWSPMETTLRLGWLKVRECTLLCNAPVFDRHGRHLFTADVLDPWAAILGEYDGVTHLREGVRRRDLGREELIRDHGFERVTMLNSDLPSLVDFGRRLVAAYRRASGPSGSWTLEQPDWWVDTTTVAKRLALSEAERETWLRWQAA